MEKLLKLVAEWKKAARGDSPPVPRARRKARDIIAELTQRLSDAEAALVSSRDQLPGEIEANVASLTAAINAGDFSAKEQLAEIAHRFHWRLCDLLKMETCSAPQLSKGPETIETQQAHAKTEVV